MTSIISSNGLGLFGNTLGASGNPLIGRAGQSDAVYVNGRTGNLVIQAQDEFLTSAGLDTALVRTYNSQGLLTDDNQDNWQLDVASLFNLPSTPNANPSGVTKRFGHGTEITYNFDSSKGLYVSTDGDGAHDTLSYSGGQWTWTDGSSRVTEIYDGTGKLISVADRDGNTTTYGYKANGLLETITDQSGQVMTLTYSDAGVNNGRNLLSISVASNGQTQTLTRYGYDDLNRLTTVTVDLTPEDNVATSGNGNSYVTTYTYDGASNRVASITQGDGTYISFAYYQSGEHQGKLQSYTDGAGKTTTLSYTQTTSTVPATANASGLSAVFNGWSAVTPLEQRNIAGVTSPQITMDQHGNGLAMWALGTELCVSSYSKAIDKWSASSVLNTGLAGNPVAPHISMSANGNALLAWVQNDNVYAKRYVAGVWDSTPHLMGSCVSGATPIGAINDNGRAVVSFVQSDGSRNNLAVILHSGAAWQESATALDDQGGANHNDIAAAMVPSVAIDAAGNVNVLWLQKNPSEGSGNDSLFMSRYSAIAETWSNPTGTLLENAAAAVTSAKIVFDRNGDGVVLFMQDSTVYAASYTRIGDSWSAPVNLNGGTLGGATGVPHLSVSPNGTYALATWIQDNNVVARRYAGGAWQGTGAEPIENQAGNVFNPVGSVSNNGRLAVMFLQTNAGGSDNTILVNRYINGAWQSSADTSIGGTYKAGALGPYTPGITIDDQGDVNTIFLRRNSSQLNYGVRVQRRYDISNGERYYSVTDANLAPPTVAERWAAIAQSVYNDAAAAGALRAAMGDPALVAGTRLLVPPVLDYAKSTSLIHTTVTDPLGQVTTYVSDAATGMLRQVISPTVKVDGVDANPTTSYVYDANGNVIEVIDGDGNVTASSYDANGNLIKRRDAAGNTVEYTYNANNQLLTETRYLAPDPDGAHSGKPSQPAVTRYVYDVESHLRFIISPEGRVQEYRYDGNGNVALTLAQSRASGKVGQRTAAIAYIQDKYTAANFTETNLVAWVNGLGVDLSKRIERVDYAYDFRGNLSKTTAYATINTTDGGGVIDGNESVTRYVYDQRGRLLQTIDPRGSTNTPNAANANLPYATTYTYDGLGRVLSTNQWLQNGQLRTTVATYADTFSDPADPAAASRVLTTVTIDSTHSLTTTSVYDKRGILLSVAQSDHGGNVLGITSYRYDVDGRLRITTDPLGNKTYLLYDGAGRVVATIDALGVMVENAYDKAGNLIRQIRYATPLSDQQVANLSAVDVQGDLLNIVLDDTMRPTLDNNQDRVTRKIYDNANRLAADITPSDTDAAQGYVTQYFYDGTGQLTDTIRYIHAIPVASLTAATSAAQVAALVKTSGEDRHVRYFHDYDGKLAATLDGEGYLTENQYNAAGELVHSIRYGNATTPSLRSTGTLAALKASIGTNAVLDQHTYHFYNAKGQLAGTLDAEGYLTTYQYDLAGNQTQHVRYYNKAAAYTGTQTLAQLIPAPHANDAVTTTSYNGANQILTVNVKAGTTSPSANGTETRYTYNNAGQLLKTERAWGADEVRTAQARYDVQGRVTQELTAKGNAALEDLDAVLDVAPPPADLAGQLDALWTQYGLNDPRPTDAAAMREAIWTQYSLTHAYDRGGRRISTIDQNGNKTLFFYDARDRLSHTVNARGEVVETRYNAFGQASESIRYTGRIATDGLNGGSVTDTLTSRLNAIAADGTGPNADSHTRINYTLRGAIKQAIDAMGKQTEYAYTAFGELKTQRDPIAAGVDTLSHRTYDRRGLLKTLVEDVDQGAYVGIERTTKREYDAFGRITQEWDGNNNPRSYAYDKLGRTVSVTDPSGTRTTAYDAFSRILSVTDARNAALATTSYAYDDSARSFTVTTPENITVKTTYNRHGQKIAVEDGRHNITTYHYDKNGNLTKTIQADGTLNLTTQAVYDRAGRLITTLDANGRATVLSYDAANRVLSRAIDPPSHTHPVTGEAVANPGGLNLVTSYSFDGQGRTVTVTDPGGTVTHTTFDANGRVTQTAVDPATIVNANDGTSAPNPDGLNLRTVYGYDDQGRVLTVTTGAGTAAARTTKYVYDRLGRRIETHVDPVNYIDPVTGDNIANPDALDLTTYHTYDGNNNVISTTDANGHKTHYYYDGSDRLIYTLDALDGLAWNEYDGRGNLIKRTRFASSLAGDGFPAEPTRAQIDARRAVIADPQHDEVTSYYYDKDSRLIATVDAMGYLIERKLNANGNPDQIVAWATALPARPGADTRPTPVAGDTCHTTSFYYDQAERLVASVDGAGNLVERKLDANGNLVQNIVWATPVARTAPETIPAADASDVANNKKQTTSYYYDGANRLVATVDGMGYLIQQELNAAGKVMRSIAWATAIARTAPETHPAPVANDASRVTSYYYDDAHRLVATVDPEGYLVERELDANGNEVRRIAWNTAVTLTVPGVKPTAVANDTNHIVSTYYDKGNRVKATVDGEGYLVEFEWDGKGKLKKRTAWETAIDRPAVDTYPSPSPTDVTGNRRQVVSYDYDANGRLHTETNGLGQITTYGYDAKGNRTSVISALAGPLTTSDETYYLELRKQFGATTAGGAGMSAAEVAANPAVQANLIARCTTTYSYDAADRLVQVKDPKNHTETYTYDAYGNRIVVTDKRGHQRVSYYDDNNRKTLEVDAEGYVTQYTYTSTGKIKSHTLFSQPVAVPANPAVLPAPTSTPSLDRTVTYEYNDRDELIRRIDGEGYRTEYSYDSAGNRTESRQAFDLAATQWATTRYYYDKRGQLRFTLSPAGFLTEQRFDAYGNRTHLLTYDTPLTSLPAAGAMPVPAESLEDRGTTWQYDKNNRAYNETRRVRHTDQGTQYVTQSITYDAHGNRRVVTDAVGSAMDTRTIEYKYDAANRLTDVIRPVTSSQSVTTHYAHDAVGNVVTRYDAYQTGAANERITWFLYDENNRLVLETNPLLASTLMTYDENGNLRTRTIGTGGDTRTEIHTYDRNNRRISTEDAAGNVTGYAYNAAGETSSTTNANYQQLISNDNSYYGELRQRLGAPAAVEHLTDAHRMIMKAACTITYRHDRNGRLVAVQDANGIETRYTYDGQGNKRTERQAYGMVGEERLTSYDYDPDGRLTNVFNALGGVTEYRYDGGSRNISLTVDANGNEESRTYDLLGRLETVIRHGGEHGGIKIAHEYDLRGNIVKTTTSHADGADARAVIFTYDKMDRRVSMTDDEGFTTTYGHNDHGEQTSVTRGQYLLNQGDAGFVQAKKDRAFPLTISYTYDKGGRVETMTDGAGNVTRYGYDVANNRTSVTVADNELGDGRGGITEKRTTGYKYDKANRLTEIYTPMGGAIQPQTVYLYDAAGNKITEKILQRAARSFIVPNDVSNDAAGWNLIAGILYGSNSPAVGAALHARVGADVDLVAGMVLADLPASLAGHPLNAELSTREAVWSVTNYEYDNQGRMTASVDAHLVRTEYVYDAVGNLKTTIYAKGTADQRTVKAEYDLLNRKTADIDALDNRTAYRYDAVGNRIKVTDALGYVAHYYYNALNQLTTVLDPEHGGKTFEYDSGGRVIKERTHMTRYVGAVSDTVPPALVDADSDRIVEFIYDGSGQLREHRLADGTVHQFAYNGAGLKITDTLFGNAVEPRVLHYEYDGNGRLSKLIDVDGTETTYDYDGAGNKTREITMVREVPEALDLRQRRITEYDYDLNNRNTARRVYEEKRLQWISGPVTTKTLLSDHRYGYDLVGNRVSETAMQGEIAGSALPIGATGTARFFHYDKLNRLTDEATDLGLLHLATGEEWNPAWNDHLHYEYDLVGNRKSVTDRRGYTTEYKYDKCNRLTHEIQPEVTIFTIAGGAQSLRPEIVREYDALGRVVQITDANGYKTSNWFDGRGLQIAQRNGDDAFVEYRYNMAGQQLEKTEYAVRMTGKARVLGERPTPPVGERRVTSYAYDKAGRLTQTTLPEVVVHGVVDGELQPGNSKRPAELHLYDHYGNQIASRDRNENWSYFFYDSKGRVAASVDVLGYMAEFDYDRQGKLVRKKIYTKQLDQATLNGLKQQADAAWTQQEATGQPVAQLARPAVPAPAAATHDRDELYVTDYEYDALGRLTQELAPEIIVTDPHKFGSILESPHSAHRPKTTYAYGLDGNLFSKTVGAGTPEALTDYYFYDRANRLSSTVEGVTNAGNDGILTTFDHDGNGNVTMRRRYYRAVPESALAVGATREQLVDSLPAQYHEQNQAIAYTYDSLNRLATQTDWMHEEQYSLDDNDDDIVQAFSYDAAGNRTRHVDGDGYVTRMAYDAAGRLIESIDPEKRADTVFEYDVFGNLVRSYSGFTTEPGMSRATGMAAKVANNIGATSVGDEVTLNWTVRQGTMRSWVVYGRESIRDINAPWLLNPDSGLGYTGKTAVVTHDPLAPTSQAAIKLGAIGYSQPICFRVVTEDDSGNLTWSEEKIIRPAPHYEQLSITRPTSTSLSVQVRFDANVESATLDFGAPGQLYSTVNFVQQPNSDVWTALIEAPAGVDPATLAYAVNWKGVVNGAIYRGEENLFATALDRAGIRTTASTEYQPGDTYRIALTSAMPSALHARFPTIRALYRSASGSENYRTADVTAVVSAGGVTTYRLTLGGDTPLIMGNYEVMLEGLDGSGKPIAVLDRFNYFVQDGAPTTVHNSASVPAPAEGLGSSMRMLVNGAAVTISPDRDDEDLAGAPPERMLADLPPLAAGASADYVTLFGDEFSATHTASVTAGNVTASALDLNLQATLSAAEVQNVGSEGLYLGWSAVGGESTTFVQVAATGGNGYAVTVRALPRSGQYNLELYYLDKQGNKVIVERRRVDTVSWSSQAWTGRSLTLHAEERGRLQSQNGAIVLVQDSYREYRHAPLDVSLRTTQHSHAGMNTDFDEGLGMSHMAESTYDALNAKTKSNDQDGLWREFRVNANGDTVATVLYGKVESGAYVPNDEEDPTGPLMTLFERDAGGRLVKQWDEFVRAPDNSYVRPMTNYTYDVLNRVTSKTTSRLGPNSVPAPRPQGWDAEAVLRESLSGSVSQVQTAFDRNGNGFAIFVSGNDLYWTEYDKNTNTWSDPAVEGLDGTHKLDGSLGYFPQYPHMSMSANGNVVVTWHQSNGNYVRTRINGVWSPARSSNPVKLSTTFYGGGQQRCAIADNGRAVVTFVENNNIYAYIFDGSSWQQSPAGQSIDDLGGTNTGGIGNSFKPSVYIDESGDIVLMWLQANVGESALSLRYARYSAATGQWTAPVGNQIESSNDAIGDAKMVLDKDGNGWVLFTQGSNSYYNATVYARRYTKGATNPWGELLNFGTTSQGYHIDLSLSPDGRSALALWTRSTPGGNSNGYTDVVARRYVDGQWVGTGPEVVENRTGMTFIPRGSISNSGEAIVVFANDDSNSGGARSFYASRFANGAWSGVTEGSLSLESINYSVDNNAANSPISVAIDGDGNVNVLWTQGVSNTGAWNLYGRRYESGRGRQTDSRTWRYEYNAVGLVRETNPNHGVNGMNGQVHTYMDQFGRVTAIVSAANRVSLKFYDNKGRLEEERDGNGTRIAYGYDRLDRMVSKTDGRGLATTGSSELERGDYTIRYEYDQRDRLLKVRQAQGFHLAYDDRQMYKDERERLGYTEFVPGTISGERRVQAAADLNESDKQTLIDLYTTTYRYDGRNNRIEMIANGSNQRNEAAAPYGWERKLQNVQRIQEIYDGLGRITKTRRRVDPDGERSLHSLQWAETEREYDVYGNLVKETDAENRVTIDRRYGAFGRLAWDFQKDIEYDYDNYGHVQSERKTTGSQSIAKHYDRLGRLTRIENSETGVSTEYTYTLDGLRHSEKTTAPDPMNGNTPKLMRDIRYFYDDKGQLKRWHDWQTCAHENFEYDADGYLTRVFTDTWAEDDWIPENSILGGPDKRFAKWMGPVNDVGAPLPMDPDSTWRKINNYYEYDNGGRLKRKYRLSGSNEETVLRTYEYDAANNVVASFDGVSNIPSDNVKREFKYQDGSTGIDANNRRAIARGSSPNPNGPEDVEQKWQYDVRGNVTHSSEKTRFSKPGAVMDSMTIVDSKYNESNQLYYQYSSTVKDEGIDGSTVRNTWQTQTIDYDYAGRVDLITNDSDGTVTADGDTTDLTAYRMTYQHDYRSDGQIETIEATRDDLDDEDVENIVRHTWNYYDAFGQRKEVVREQEEGMVANAVASYVTDNEGRILFVKDDDGKQTGGSHQRITAMDYLYANGTPRGEIGTNHEGGTVCNFDRGDYDSAPQIASMGGRFSYYPSLQANSPDSSFTYVVQAGDTLQLIAQKLFGTGSLWYVIADANGLTGNETLTPNMSLRIPNTTQNGIGHREPLYNESHITGSLLPSAVPAPPEVDKCAAVGTIIVAVVVAVAVSVATWGAATGIAAAGVSAVATAALTAAAGAGIAVVGETIRQTTNMVAGWQKGFDMGQVAVAGIGGAFGGAASGLGAYAKAAQLMGTAADMAKLAQTGLSVAGQVSTQLLSRHFAKGKDKRDFNWSGIFGAAIPGLVGLNNNTIAADVGRVGVSWASLAFSSGESTDWANTLSTTFGTGAGWIPTGNNFVAQTAVQLGSTAMAATMAYAVTRSDKGLAAWTAHSAGQGVGNGIISWGTAKLENERSERLMQEEAARKQRWAMRGAQAGIEVREKVLADKLHSLEESTGGPSAGFDRRLYEDGIPGDQRLAVLVHEQVGVWYDQDGKAHPDVRGYDVPVEELDARLDASATPYLPPMPSRPGSTQGTVTEAKHKPSITKHVGADEIAAGLREVEKNTEALMNWKSEIDMSGVLNESHIPGEIAMASEPESAVSEEPLMTPMQDSASRDDIANAEASLTQARAHYQAIANSNYYKLRDPNEIPYVVDFDIPYMGSLFRNGGPITQLRAGWNREMDESLERVRANEIALGKYMGLERGVNHALQFVGNLSLAMLQIPENIANLPTTFARGGIKVENGMKLAYRHNKPGEAALEIGSAVAETALALLDVKLGLDGLSAVKAAGAPKNPWITVTDEAMAAHEVTTVTRWGRPGLQSGDWVMEGGPTATNYFLSGKWQPGLGNQFASIAGAETFVVPKSALVPPEGYGVDGGIKALFGQYRYQPAMSIGSGEGGAIARNGRPAFINVDEEIPLGDADLLDLSAPPPLPRRINNGTGNLPFDLYGDPMYDAAALARRVESTGGTRVTYVGPPVTEHFDGEPYRAAWTASARLSPDKKLLTFDTQTDANLGKLAAERFIEENHPGQRYNVGSGTHGDERGFNAATPGMSFELRARSFVTTDLIMHPDATIFDLSTPLTAHRYYAAENSYQLTVRNWCYSSGDRFVPPVADKVRP
ncbi:MAG TPA: LysM peptidoglycan-binding domain-containing protein [Paucimonas sp.]|nr:LysM peptidoglycan-binding domain-containing protein [Paucimonas sp.]